MSDALDDLKNQIRTYLSQYLTELKVEPERGGQHDPWYCCLNPDHEDRTPSMHFVKGSNKTVLKCFSCSAAYDIFHIAHIFEDRPIEGKSFFHHNVYYLADHFKIPYEKPQLTDEELLSIRIQNTYEDAAKVLKSFSGSDPDTAFQHTRSRGLLDHTCTNMGVATMPWDNFERKMCFQYRYSKEWLSYVGINSKYIGIDFITFVLRDANNNAIALARRWVYWSKTALKEAKESGSRYEPKYLNSDSSQAKSFNKSRFLYGLNIAKKANTGSIDLVEGYTDCLAMIQAGHESVAAICSADLTDQQIELLKKLNFTKVNLVLDADEAGVRSMDKYLKTLRHIKGIKFTVTHLGFESDVSQDNRDPCYWIQTYGLETYLKQPRQTAFDWELNKLLASSIEHKEIAHKMVDYVVSEQSAIERDHLINTLSEKTGVTKEAIAEDVQQHTLDKADKTINETLRKLKRASTIQEKANLISVAKTNLDQMTNTVSDDEFSVTSAVEYARECINGFINAEAGMPGWDCGIQCINQSFGGIPKKKELIGFSGNPNTGKSTILYNICEGLIANREKNANLCCVFWTLDDPVETLLAKLLAVRSGFTINQCRYPGSHNLLSNDAYKNSIDDLLTSINDGYLVPRGIEIGGRTEDCERLLKTVQDETQRDLVVFVDNFHSISTDGDDMRIHFKQAAEWMQKVSDTMNLTFICSLEPTKQAMHSHRPRMEHIGETAKIQFAFKLLGMVYNELHEKRETAKVFWEDENAQKRPVIEINYEKNKITAFKGTHYFKFYEDRAKILETTEQEVRAAQIANHQTQVANLTGAQKLVPIMSPTEKTDEDTHWEQ